MITKTVGFTPGPWSIGEYPDDIKAGKELIASIYGRYANGSLAHPLPNDCEAAANVRLIATAPELLEALENIVNFGKASEWDKATTGCQILLANAQAAIRKARNE